MATPAVANNNPGNLKDPATGTFRTFPTREQGESALEADLTGKVTGKTSTGLKPTSTLYDFASTYAPKSDDNDPKRYAENLAKQLGVPPTTPLSSLQSRIHDFAGAVAHNEDPSAPTLQKAPTGTYASAQVSGGTETFAGKIKAKYPQYADIPDAQLEQKILAKYPQYADIASQLTQPISTPQGGGYTAPVTPDNPAGVGGGASLANAGKNLAALPGQVAEAGNALLPAVGDIYHDIKGDNKKTGLQQLGDAGTTALTVGSVVAPELGLGKAGLLAKAGGNAALGAGFGVSGALGAGEKDPMNIATSGGIGAVTGGILGGISGAIGNRAEQTGESRLTELTGKLKTLGKSFRENSVPASAINGKTDPITTLLQSKTDDGSPLIQGLSTPGGKVDVGSLTNESGTGSVDNAIETHSQAASALVDQLQRTKGPGVGVKVFKSAVEDDLKNDPTIRGTLALQKNLSKFEGMIESAQKIYGNTLPWTAIDEIRAGMNRNYDPAERDLSRVIGDTARKFLYNGDSTNTALRSAMQNEAELIRARNFLQKIHGVNVGKGQLGRYFSRLIGGGVGAALGSLGGPIGEAAGVAGGAYTADAIENAIAGHYFSPLGAGVANKARGLLNSPAGGAARAGILRGTTSTSR